MPSLAHTVCGLEEIASHRSQGVTHVLSILDPDWPEPDFSGYDRPLRTVLRFHDAILPGPGLVLPERRDVEAILAFGQAASLNSAADTHILVHCHLGISRSTAALLALLARDEPGTSAGALVATLHALRAAAWPNARMVAFADDALGRQGTLIEAVRRLHGVQLARDPSLAAVMRDLNRADEVEAALAP